jgi:non-haem Fe2+, alpha-ketoglutarate-dependent halogenase
MNAATDPLITDEQVARYHRDGYVIPNFRIPDEDLAQMRRAYDELLARNPDIKPDIMLGPHLEKPGAQGVKGSREWLEFGTRPELLDIAARLVGDDLILWGTTIFGKPARQGKETPWHQDGDYYPIRPLETITIWIALDDVTPENGPLRMIPGSHRQRKLFSHHWEENEDLSINLVCDAEHFDESTAEDLMLEAGQVSFHDVYMIHGSRPNTTDRRRAAFVVRIMPGHCHYDHKLGEEMAQPHSSHDYGRRPLFLIRGRDQTGRNDFSIGH